MNTKAWKRLGIIVTALAALVALSAPEARAGDSRLVVRMAEPFEVAGQQFASGVVTLRQLSDYNPTSTLNEVWVGNECLGMLLARELPHQERATDDSLIFRRDAGDTLVLVGMSFRGKRARELVRFHPAEQPHRWTAPQLSSLLAEPPMLLAHRF